MLILDVQIYITSPAVLNLGCRSLRPAGPRCVEVWRLQRWCRWQSVPAWPRSPSALYCSCSDILLITQSILCWLCVHTDINKPKCIYLYIYISNKVIIYKVNIFSDSDNLIRNIIGQRTFQSFISQKWTNVYFFSFLNWSRLLSHETSRINFLSYEVIIKLHAPELIKV